MVQRRSLDFSSLQRLSREQAAVLGAYTGVLLGPFEDMRRYMTSKLGYPPLIHEMGSMEFISRIHDLAKPDMEKMFAADE